MAIAAHEPDLFTSEDIKAALTMCGPMGVSLGTSALTVFGSHLLEGGSIDTAANHVSLAASLGLLYPTSLSCSHQGNASISYRADVVSTDGSEVHLVHPHGCNCTSGLKTSQPRPCWHRCAVAIVLASHARVALAGARLGLAA